MIEIKGLGKQFQNETQISYRDITFETGRSYMLLGASGCGKSTLLNMIAGVLSPTVGTIQIDGKDMTAASQKEKDKFRIEKIGYIFQDFKLINERTVADNIGILRLEGIGISGMDEILTALDISEKKNAKIKHLSGGQKQRVAIAGVIAMEPKCIVLDEPTAMLDPRGRKEVMETIRRLNADKDITVILITHHMDEAAQAQRVVVLDKGKVALDGSPREVFSQVQTLHNMGLAAPETVELCWELNQNGFTLPLERLSAEECAQTLYDAIKV